MPENTTNISKSALFCEIRATFRLGFPIIGAQLLMFSMVFVDNVMVGSLGADPLASLALATGIYSLTNIVVIGMLGAISPMITQPIGRGEFGQVGHVMRQGWIFAFLLTSILVFVLWNASFIMRALDQKPDLIPLAQSYLRVMCVTAPAHMIVIATRHLTEGSGDSMIGAIIMGVAALLNIPLDYAMIHGHWGMPSLGVAGAATATAILSWFSALTLLVYLHRRKSYQQYALWSRTWTFDIAIMKEMCRIGFPLGGAIAAEMAFFVFSTFLMGTITKDVLAAHQVALNAASMAFMIPLGLSFAVAIRVGRFHGSGDVTGVRTAWLAGVIIALLTQSITAIGFFGFPGLIVKLYSQSDVVAALATRLLMVAAFFQLFDGMQVVGMGGLRGLKDTGFAFKSTMVSFWGLGATTVAIAYYGFDKSAIGIWMGLLVGLGTASIFHHTRIFLKTRLHG